MQSHHRSSRFSVSESSCKYVIYNKMMVINEIKTDNFYFFPPVFLPLIFFFFADCFYLNVTSLPIGLKPSMAWSV